MHTFWGRFPDFLPTSYGFMNPDSKQNLGIVSLANSFSIIRSLEEKKRNVKPDLLMYFLRVDEIKHY